MTNLSQTRRRDAHEMMADIFNGFDRQTETRFMTALEQMNRESSERIKSLMFTFEDLSKLDNASAQTLMRSVDKDKLAVALKGANEAVRDFFLKNMSSRAAKMLTDDMEALGPVRLRDVDEAQAALVNMAKDLAGQGRHHHQQGQGRRRAGVLMTPVHADLGSRQRRGGSHDGARKIPVRRRFRRGQRPPRLRKSRSPPTKRRSPRRKRAVTGMGFPPPRRRPAPRPNGAAPLRSNGCR